MDDAWRIMDVAWRIMDVAWRIPGMSGGYLTWPSAGGALYVPNVVNMAVYTRLWTRPLSNVQDKTSPGTSLRTSLRASLRMSEIAPNHHISKILRF